MSVQADFGQARASFAYIFKIEVDGELFLVGNEHPDNWRYQPVGGGYHYFDESKAVIDKYFAPKPAPSIHEQLNGWLSKEGEGEGKLDSDYEFNNLSIPGGLVKPKLRAYKVQIMILDSYYQLPKYACSLSIFARQNQ